MSKKIKIPRRLTLKLARKLCLKQWRWIVKQIKAGDTSNIDVLKHRWVDDHIENKDCIRSNCFYCTYANQAKGDSLCVFCPARKIDPKFNCSSVEYHFFDYPLDFYAELLRLKRIEDQKK